MTNAELIQQLRGCKDIEYCNECPRMPKGIFEPCNIKDDAADALEAAEKRIAVVEEERDLERFAAKNYLDKIDELKAQIPKEGKWIEQDDGNSIYHKCSACGKNQYNVLLEMMQGEYHYCPNCGAKMQTVTDCHTLEEG